MNIFLAETCRQFVKPHPFCFSAMCKVNCYLEGKFSDGSYVKGYECQSNAFHSVCVCYLCKNQSLQIELKISSCVPIHRHEYCPNNYMVSQLTSQLSSIHRQYWLTSHFSRLLTLFFVLISHVCLLWQFYVKKHYVFSGQTLQ